MKGIAALSVLGMILLCGCLSDKESLNDDEIMRNNLAVCDGLPVLFNDQDLVVGKQYCYMELAGFMGEVNICDKVTDENLKISCISDAARLAQNVSLCERLPDDYKDGCYSDVGIAKNDPSICSKVSDEYQYIKDSCYSFIAADTLDTTLCERMQWPGEREWCYTVIAGKKNDSTLCSKITSDLVPNFDGYDKGNESVMNICYLSAAKNIEECDAIKTANSNTTDRCYWKVGGAKQDLEICDMISNEELKGGCYNDVALAKKDESICSRIKDGKYFGMCLKEIAKAKKDVRICDKFNNLYDIDQCLEGVAEESGDISICDKIQNRYSKDPCYQAIARLKDNLSVCDKIEDPIYKEPCIRDLQWVKRDKNGKLVSKAHYVQGS